MAAAAVFCAFLAPFAALIAGLALITFSSLKRASKAKQFFFMALFVGGITASGWAPILLSRSIGLGPYLTVVILSSMYQAIVVIFVSAEMLSEKLTDQGTRPPLRPQKAC
jgi:hypothetical protein